MKHISQVINKFADDSCIKTVKKYISDNEFNTKVKYHKIYHILSKKVKTFKAQDAQAFINKLNQDDDFQYLCDCIEINSNENRLQYIIFASKNNYITLIQMLSLLISHITSVFEG